MLTRDNRYDPFTASDSMNSLIGMIFSSISKAPVEVLGLESFFSRYFLFTPPTQDVHASVMTGRIIAVYIHRMLVEFDPHALPTLSAV